MDNNDNKTKNNSFLKGNFTTKKDVVEKIVDASEDPMDLREALRKKALASLGGSMVYMERTDLVWDGADD